MPALVEAAQTELTLALEEIRELVHGLHPRLLGDRGLGPALEALAERAVLPVEIVEVPSVTAAGCGRGGRLLHHRGSPRERRQAQPRLAA